MTPILAFDIETIPDCEGIRKLHDLPADLPDHEVAEVAFQKRRAVTGSRNAEGRRLVLPVPTERNW